MGVAESSMGTRVRQTIISVLLLVVALAGAATAAASGDVVDSRLRGFEMVAENEFLQLYFLEDTAEIAVRDRATGSVWFSNPYDRATAERVAKGTAKDRLGAQFVLNYFTPRDELKEMDSYNDSVKHQQVEMFRLDAGIRVEYTVGQQWNNDAYTPVMMFEDTFNELILANIPDSGKKLFTDNYDFVMMVEVSDDHPAADAYNVDPSVLGNYTLTIVGQKMAQRNVKTLAEGFVDQIVAHRKDITSRKDLRAGDVPEVLKERPVYVLKPRARAWDLEEMVALLKEADVSPVDLQRDYEALGLDPSEANPVVFGVAIEYVLDGKNLVVRVPADSLKYPVDAPTDFGTNAAYPLYSISVLPYFGAMGTSAEGYILVPDGSGALITLNNGKTQVPAYAVRVYGADRALDAVQTQRTLTTQVCLPVFGIKAGEDALFGVIEGAKAAGRISADVAGRTDSYNKVYTAFAVIPRGTTSLESYTEWRQGASGTRQSINVYQARPFQEDIVIRYSFLHGEDASYSGMARTYQDYLVSTGVLTGLADGTDDLPFVLELVGAISVRRPVLGTPRYVVEPLTTFDQAKEIVDRFTVAGVREIAVRYTGWIQGGLYHTFPDGVRVEKALGGQKKLVELSSYLSGRGVDLYPDVAFVTVYQNKLLDGFWTMRDSARYLNKKPAVEPAYHLISSQLDTTRSFNVLSARRLPSVVSAFAQDYSKLGIAGLSLKDLGAQVNSDFREDLSELVDREQAVQITQAQMAMLTGERKLKLMVEMGNDYSLPYASFVVGAPLDSSRYNILDRSVPFYQMVMHGYLNYAGSPLNMAQDPVFERLRTIESGAVPYYQLTYSESSEVKRTRANHLFAMNFEDWVDEAAEFYEEANRILGPLHGLRIVDHSELSPLVFQTLYENGNAVLVNYNDVDVTISGVTIPAKGYGFVEEALTSE